MTPGIGSAQTEAASRRASVIDGDTLDIHGHRFGIQHVAFRLGVTAIRHHLRCDDR